eukprot:270419-Pleurochrysis_carterae.AAC.2
MSSTRRADWTEPEPRSSNEIPSPCTVAIVAEETLFGVRTPRFADAGRRRRLPQPSTQRRAKRDVAATFLIGAQPPPPAITPIDGMGFCSGPKSKIRQLISCKSIPVHAFSTAKDADGVRQDNGKSIGHDGRLVQAGTDTC